MHRPEQTPYITKALVDLAVANKLTHLFHDQYETHDGKRLTQTELGYIDTECFNYKLKYGELTEDYNHLKSEVDAIKAERKRLVLENKELSIKTLFKLSTILRDDMSDKEKIIQIRKYLNV